MRSKKSGFHHPAKSTKPATTSFLRKTLIRLIGLGIGFVLVLQLYYFIQIWWWVDHNPQSTSFMDHQLSLLQEKNPDAKLKYRWVPYQRISPNLKRAIIAAEDSAFIDHEGVDWEALERAYERNASRGKVVAGGSTITQQLAKNLFLSGERSYLRKLQELVIAYMLEFWMDKRRILEIYLNVVEWGVGVFGAEAAAMHYYGVTASNLNAMQSARLAVMLPKPRFYDRNRGSAYLAKRAMLIARRMNAVAPP